MINKYNIPTMIAILFFLTTINCNDNSNPSSASTSVRQSDLIGNWILVKEIEGDGIDADTEFFDTTSIRVFTQNEVIDYDNEGDNCTHYDHSEYTLNGNQFDSYLSYEGSTISIQNNLLIISVSDSDGVFKGYWTKYSGSVPPANWPKTICEIGAFKK